MKIPGIPSGMRKMWADRGAGRPALKALAAAVCMAALATFMIIQGRHMMQSGTIHDNSSTTIMGAKLFASGCIAAPLGAGLLIAAAFHGRAYRQRQMHPKEQPLNS